MASPLALLAATCSKIGSAQEQLQGLSGKATQQQIKVVANTLSAALLQQLQQQNQQQDATTVESEDSQMAPRDPLASPSPPPATPLHQPQVITLAQLQNLLPLQQVSAAASDISQLQGQTVKSFVSSAAGLSSPTVVSVQGLPGQFLQVI